MAKKYYNQSFVSRTNVDNTNIEDYAKKFYGAGGKDRIWTTEQLLKKLKSDGIKYTVRRTRGGREISIDKNALNNNDVARRYYDDRMRLRNDSSDAYKAKSVFANSSEKLVNKINGSRASMSADVAVAKIDAIRHGGYNMYLDGAELRSPNPIQNRDWFDHLDRTRTRTIESGDEIGQVVLDEYYPNGHLRGHAKNVAKYSAELGHDITADNFVKKYKKLVKDSSSQGRKYDLNNDAEAMVVKSSPKLRLSVYEGGRRDYKVDHSVEFPYAWKSNTLKPKDSFKLVDFEAKTKVNDSKPSDQTLENDGSNELFVSDMRNKVAAQKTFSKPREEESKVPKFTSIGRSSMGNMLELYNEKGNVVESMSPTAKNVRKVMKHLGVGDDNSSDDDVKTWFKDFSKQTDKGKRITLNTTSKKK